MEPTLHLQQQKKWFTRVEIKQLFITVLALSIFVSFGQWGEGERFFVDGFPNFLQALHLVFVIIFFNVLIKKWVGKKLGYIVTYAYAPVMLFIGFLLAFFSSGLWPFLIMGYTTYKLVPRLRVDKKQGGYRNADTSKVIVSGLVFNFTLAFIGKTLYLMTGALYFNDVTTLAILIALFSLIPFDLLSIFLLRIRDKISVIPSDGTCLLYHSRALYVYVFAFLVLYAALIYSPGLWSVFFSLLFGLTCYFVFRRYIEIKSQRF